jgi:pyruvate-formate lyase
MKHLKPTLIAIVALFALSFVTIEDYSKFIIGKWELVKMITPDNKEIDIKKFIGESYMEFKSDKTYFESGTDTTNGVWQIVESKYLQTKKENQIDFTEKMEIQKITLDEAKLITPNKTVLFMKRVK